MMKRVLEKVLDSYDRRLERREESFERTLTRGVEALSDRRTLKRYIIILSVVNVLIWASVLLVPNDVLWAFERISSIDGKLTGMVLAVVWGIGLWLTYSLFRLKYPQLGKPL